MRSATALPFIRRQQFRVVDVPKIQRALKVQVFLLAARKGNCTPSCWSNLGLKMKSGACGDTCSTLDRFMVGEAPVLLPVTLETSVGMVLVVLPLAIFL